MTAARSASVVLAALRGRGETLAVAESLTGGLVAGELTGVPGASAVFRGSVTAYATELKRDLLGVVPGLLRERGAVDAEVARQMADGARRVLGADWGIATTGVAGPEPQDGKPVGTVFVAVAGPGGVRKVTELRLNGSRSDIRRESVRGVLELLADSLAEGSPERPVGEPAGNARAQDTEHNGGT
ncbi:CinA family protein [Streptomyces candidus]|uniref:Nicotinamide-nucleotide amidase n=1 Tax=Streptomyces candidus TaxID=67283 RepID=A0A7X0HDA6_9ACTN|nr:nicotinamide-nucleotide amidohydrolase family protein [Streptomyces candidus]MBB6434182.1 nicotinamide-nucleotide amidase [Streptomyces candidus]